MTNADALEAIKRKCAESENGHSWRGFRLGDEGAVLVQMRRKTGKYYLLRVVDVLETNNDFGVIEVDDPRYDKENGIARRYNTSRAFVLEDKALLPPT